MTDTLQVANTQVKPDLIEETVANINVSFGVDYTATIMNIVIKSSGDISLAGNNLEAGRARDLSVSFLEGLDKAGELVAMSTRYELEMIQAAKKAYAHAFLVLAPQHGYKTAKDKEMFAELDDQYAETKRKLDNAKAFRILIEAKRDDLAKAHHLMRKIAEGDISGLDLSGGSPEVPTGRVPWRNLGR